MHKPSAMKQQPNFSIAKCRGLFQKRPKLKRSQSLPAQLEKEVTGRSLFWFLPKHRPAIPSTTGSATATRPHSLSSGHEDDVIVEPMDRKPASTHTHATYGLLDEESLDDSTVYSSDGGFFDSSMNGSGLFGLEFCEADSP